jgi:hypothetical protein
MTSTDWSSVVWWVLMGFWILSSITSLAGSRDNMSRLVAVGLACASLASGLLLLVLKPLHWFLCEAAFIVALQLMILLAGAVLPPDPIVQEKVSRSGAAVLFRGLYAVAVFVCLMVLK